jgi:hypothetical protein
MTSHAQLFSQGWLGHGWWGWMHVWIGLAWPFSLFQGV